MSTADKTPPSVDPLLPAWPVDEPETVVWQGEAQLSSQRDNHETQLVITWGPALELRYRQDLDGPYELAQLQQASADELRLRIPELDLDVPATPAGPQPGGVVSKVSWGDDSGVERIRFHLTNFPKVLLRQQPLRTEGPAGIASWVGTMTATGARWRLRLDARQQLKALTEELRGGASYRVTFIGELTRTDGAVFDPEELEDALDCVQLLFSFARAAWAAPMLPVGYDKAGQPIWWEAGARHCTAGLGRGVTWLDRADGPGLQEVAELWLERWQDESLWQHVLRRAVIYYLEANRSTRDNPSFVEFKYTMAQAGLELLAWAVLKGDPATEPSTDEWMERGPAAENMRRLLTWADVPTEVPSQLPALQRVLNEHPHDWTDAADVIAWLRNQVLHPTFQDERFGPEPDVHRQGWQLACRWLELVLLRRLGYTGEISSRLDLRHHVGQTEPVPWAT